MIAGKITGKRLAQELGLNCEQALYSEWGNFYAPIKRYPCILFDEFGYLVINSPAEASASGVRLGKRTNVPNLISSASSYRQVAAWQTNVSGEIFHEKKSAYYEGAVETINVNRYERNKEARRKCIAHYGQACQACDIDLSKKYGSVAENFTHVHHIKKLSTISAKYQIDPVTDLIPLCPNCHAIAHLRKEPYSVQQIKSMIAAQNNSSNSLVD